MAKLARRGGGASGADAGGREVPLRPEESSPRASEDAASPGRGDAAPARARQASGSAPKRATRRRAVTREWVLERLVSNVNRAMQAEAVTLRGVPTGEYRYEGSVANRALELIGKELGLFGERRESPKVNHVISGEPLTEDEWEELYIRKG